MIKFSKKMLALIMSMLMIFSCMAVSASATGTETEPVTENIQIPSPQCEFDQETMTISVKMPSFVEYEELNYYTKVTVTPDETITVTDNGDGTWTIKDVELETEYTVTAEITDDIDDGKTVTGTAAVKVTPTITVPSIKKNCAFDETDRTITVSKPENIIIGGTSCYVGVELQPEASSKTFGDGSTLFFNLDYATKYTVKAYVAPSADSKTYYSEDNFEVTVKNKQDTPAAPIPTTITSTSITIDAAAGCDYTITKPDGTKETKKSEGNATIVFDKLTPETDYTITAQKPANDNYYASAEAKITVTTKRTGKAGTPTLVLVDKTNTSITVFAGNGVEYKLNNGSWQISGEFKNLKANTQYNIYARYVFDSSKEDPSEVSKAFIVKTNAVANFEANEKKISFSGENGAYANSDITFTVKGDGPADMNKVVYGDTRIVPVLYSVSFGETTIKETTAFSNLGKVTNSGSFTAPNHPEKTVNVKVIFALEEYKGKNADGTANWVRIKSFDKDFNLYVGRVDSPATRVLEFFEGILNFLLNTIPAFIAEAMQSDVWGKLFEALGKLGGAMG